SDLRLDWHEPANAAGHRAGAAVHQFGWHVAALDDGRYRAGTERDRPPPPHRLTGISLTLWTHFSRIFLKSPASSRWRFSRSGRRFQQGWRSDWPPSP